MNHARRREAFTLIEIMFALVAGLIAISVVYSLNNGTTRLLAEQNRIAGTQTSLRLAMEQVRADIERAGFLSSPNNANESVCGTAPFTVQAVEFSAGTFTGNVPNAAAHRVVADRLRLTGNYVTSGHYYVSFTDTTTLEFDSAKQSFRRDFGRADGVTNVAIDADAFTRVFRPGGTRMIRIETENQNFIYSHVSSVTIPATSSTTPEVRMTITNPVTFDGICLMGLGGGSTVTPINRIEYAVLNPNADTELSALLGDTAAIAGIPSVLVRYEIDSNGTKIANTMRVVLENAVDFHLSFDVDTASGPNTPPAMLVDQDDYGSFPQRVRAVRVRLAVRTSEAEPNHPFVARGSTAPLTHYYARDTDVGAAAGRPSSRVRTLSSVVFVPNVAYADMP